METHIKIGSYIRDGQTHYYSLQLNAMYLI